MQRVGAVIGGQLKTRAIQFERAVRDPVGVAPDGSAKETPDREIARKVIAAKHHVGNSSGAIRREDGLQRRAIGNDAHLETRCHRKPHSFNRGAVR